MGAASLICRDERLKRNASSIFAQGEPQSTVARLLNVDQSTISRLALRALAA
jgi:DNA-binding transcriptional regulator LsrR (DeoR family)